MSNPRELAFFYPDFVSPTVKTRIASKQSSQRTLALIRPDALRHHKGNLINYTAENHHLFKIGKTRIEQCCTAHIVHSCQQYRSALLQMIQAQHYC